MSAPEPQAYVAFADAAGAQVYAAQDYDEPFRAPVEGGIRAVIDFIAAGREGWAPDHDNGTWNRAEAVEATYWYRGEAPERIAIDEARRIQAAR